MPVFRIYVEKKPEFAVEAQSVMSDVKTALRLDLTNLRILNRYDADKLSREDFSAAVNTVFSEPAVDVVYDELPALEEGDRIFAVEYLPGQFDQRADSCEQCIQILRQGERCRVKNARVYIVSGALTDEDFDKLKSYIINPVESREATLDAYQTLETKYEIPTSVDTVTGFTSLDECGLRALLDRLGLAMDLDDLTFLQAYFRDNERRDPTITEVRMIDTYWSDHCRHTTFLTQITDVDIPTDYIKETYDAYCTVRQELGRGEKPMTLMDLATIAAKKLKADGKLNDLDESEEINACSVKIKVDIDGKEEDWILMFKNETHNHPTEIEPFGGAATCLGGCIRDPLSGRSYVYQAMRVTGAADPHTPLSETLTGKLPQKKIVVEAAKGYSSYGNQIGLATGEVKEYYHPGFMAKRMEIGAVIAAAPENHVIRERPQAGDVVILVGGRTGRDGMGGATGSSKELNTESIETCGAEVQKGNPLTERKIQCLFRRGEVTRLIKRCNDFGAGGVSVAAGELTDGLSINLDSMPKKYEGLDGTELAISESQERMAVVVRKEDADRFISYAAEENLEATVIADVNDSGRLVMTWRGDRIVDISRAFLNTNGASQRKDVYIAKPDEEGFFVRPEIKDIRAMWLEAMGDLNNASQQGLAERFDSTVGAGTVLMPFGGRYQKTPADGMAAKFPVRRGQTDSASFMAHGFDPDLAEWSPFHGAVYAVLLSVTRLVAMGADWRRAYLTLQEYFEKLTDRTSWGKPAAALLGAFHMQAALGLGAIGGKDSMSGTFNDLHVPPTLVSFAVAPGKASEAVSQELKRAGNTLMLFGMPKDETGMPNLDVFKLHADFLYQEVKKGNIAAMKAVGHGGVAVTAAEMAFGNKLGVDFTTGTLPLPKYFGNFYGAIIVETAPELAEEYAKQPHTRILGTIGGEVMKVADTEISLKDLLRAYEKTLDPIFPRRAEDLTGTIPVIAETEPKFRFAVKTAITRPKVFIPTMPGTNCEVDSARAFERAGADTDIFIMRNRDAAELKESVEEMARRISRSQIVMFPGGFSAGDEPDGSGKFIAAVFRNAKLMEAMEELLHIRDGLVLGICNGFQALIKLGLVPYGEFKPLTEEAPTLTFNTIGRHLSHYVTTKVVSTKSPWLSLCRPGDLHSIPISHGEGRFIASDEQIRALIANGQVATLYTDSEGHPTYDSRYNLNGSNWSIEGITSPDGRVLGKMGHTERNGANIAKNIYGNKFQTLLEAGVKYFKG